MMISKSYRSIFRLTGTGLCCLALLGCSGDTTLGSKSFEETIGPLTIRGASFVQLPLDIPDFRFPLNLTEQPGYDEDDLDFATSVKIRDIIFRIDADSTNPAVDQFEDGNPDTFEFLSSLNLSLCEADSCEETAVPVANLPINDPQISSNTQSLSLIVEDQDIRDIIEAPGGSLLVIGVQGATPVDFVRVSADIRFRVGIGIRN